MLNLEKKLPKMEFLFDQGFGGNTFVRNPETGFNYLIINFRGRIDWIVPREQFHPNNIDEIIACAKFIKFENS